MTLCGSAGRSGSVPPALNAVKATAQKNRRMPTLISTMAVLIQALAGAAHQQDHGQHHDGNGRDVHQATVTGRLGQCVRQTWPKAASAFVHILARPLPRRQPRRLRIPAPGTSRRSRPSPPMVA